MWNRSARDSGEAAVGAGGVGVAVATGGGGFLGPFLLAFAGIDPYHPWVDESRSLS